MKAYKFLDAHFGIKSLYEKRLKISRIHELNDPFELTPYDLSDRILREDFLRFRDQEGLCHGLLCFSEDWCDPMIWAHYSDKHRGICLGFEIPAIKGDPETDIFKLVRYIDGPLPFPAGFPDLLPSQKEHVVQTILFTKYSNWKYEREIRSWSHLDDEENGLYFCDFGEPLRLSEVIMGAKCAISRKSIVKALGPLKRGVRIVNTRAAYDTFRIVEAE
jgi:hypothetical protein